MEQIAWVYGQLKKGRTLTPIIAFDGCGTMRLAAIIHTLRGRGEDIKTIPIYRGNGAKYASYKLVKNVKK